MGVLLFVSENGDQRLGAITNIMGYRLDFTDQDGSVNSIESLLSRGHLIKCHSDEQIVLLVELF